MRLSVLFILLVCTPLSVSAQQVSFLIEEVFASSEVPIEPPEGLTGGAARRYREQLQKKYEAEAAASAAESITEETVVSPSVEVQPPSVSSEPSESSVSSIFITPKKDVVAPKVKIINIQTKTQQEQDELTLLQLEEYANEASANIEDQIALLTEGFSITSTSSLGSPLPSSQRSAILRRTIRTVGQLKLFARALAESDPYLRQIKIQEDTVRVSYRREAWVLGFILFHYILETTVQGDQVTTDRPWWLAFAKDGVSDFVDTLRLEIREFEPVEDPSDIVARLKAVQRTLQTISAVSK